MGLMVESCKRSLNCCDDDERGYVERNYTRKNSSEDSDEEYFTEVDEKPPEPKKEEAPKDISDIVIKPNNFHQRQQSPWKYYEELEEIGSGMYGVVKKVRLISNPEIVRAMKIIE